MKIKAIVYSIFVSLAFIACDDDLSSVGLEIQPDGDKISVRTDTVSFTSSTQIVDAIFIKSDMAYLGSYDDPLYGNVKYGYLCNFYTSPDNVFADEVIDNKIDSVTLSILYHGFEDEGFVGDSLAPMEATVRKVMEPLSKKNYYSDIDPIKEGYISKDAPALANAIYTARDLNVPDSVYLLTETVNGKKVKVFSSHVTFKFPDTTLGEKIYNEWKRPGGKETFKDLDKFFKFFPGVYIESTYGSGNVLKIRRTLLEVHYRTHIKRNTSGKVDSLVTRSALFSTAAESTQLNIIEKNSNREKLQELVSDTEYTYLKTPAGVITQLEIPLQDIVNKIGDDDRIFNNVNLTLETAEQPAGEDMPSAIMLIHPDSAKTFFEEARNPNSVGNGYCYFATRALSSSYKYDFGNISTLIQNSIKNSTEPLKLLVVPVQFITDASGSPYATTNYFTPSGAKLKRENLKLHITTTKSNK